GAAAAQAGGGDRGARGEGGGEEAETGDDDEGEEDVPEARAEPGVREQVAGLVKACRLAATRGEIARAADLAREACALDPALAAADPLVTFLSHATVRPALPPVDPAMVEALARLLRESGDASR